MTQASGLLGTQYRLARHYLNKLRFADEALHHGQANVTYALTVFEQEWEQIRCWQAWSAKRAASESDQEALRLCLEFPLAGQDILPNRNNLADHARWLEQALEAATTLKNTQAELTILHHLTQALFRQGSLDRAEQYATTLVTRAQSVNEILFLGRGYDDLGSIEEDRGQYNDAERHYREALEIFEELRQDADMARALHGLGAVALYTGQFEDAYQYFVRHLERAEVGGSNADVCNGLLSISEALMSLDRYAEAQKYGECAVERSRLFGYKRILAAALVSLASCEVEQNHLEAACPLYEEAIQVARAVGTERNVIHGLSNLGYTFLRLARYSDARSRLEEGLQLARVGGMPRYICNLQRNLANTFLGLHEFDAARDALLESLTIGSSLGSTPQKVRTVSGVVAYYAALGQNQKAAEYAGTLLGDSNLDGPLFQPVCQQLERELGSQPYQQVLRRGKLRTLDEVVAEILAALCV